MACSRGEGRPRGGVPLPASSSPTAPAIVPAVALRRPFSARARSCRATASGENRRPGLGDPPRTRTQAHTKSSPGAATPATSAQASSPDQPRSHRACPGLRADPAIRRRRSRPAFSVRSSCAGADGDGDGATLGTGIAASAGGSSVRCRVWSSRPGRLWMPGLCWRLVPQARTSSGVTWGRAATCRARRFPDVHAELGQGLVGLARVPRPPAVRRQARCRIRGRARRGSVASRGAIRPDGIEDHALLPTSLVSQVQAARACRVRRCAAIGCGRSDPQITASS